MSEGRSTFATDLDKGTWGAIARALDTSMAAVAAAEFRRLSRGLSDEQIAGRIHGALRALGGLGDNRMPSYDAWVALFYLTWYQPSHVSLAYTLARSVPPDSNPIRTGEGRLLVEDFGCGTLAMQFGLALAGAEVLPRLKPKAPKILIASSDDSDQMKSLGEKIWRRFNEEIGKEDRYTELEELRRACRALGITKAHKYPSPTDIRWLTALHVAYEENAEAVKDAMDRRVSSWEPHVILVTARKMAESCMYAPTDHLEYAAEGGRTLSAGDIRPVEGVMEETTGFRRGLYDRYGEEIDCLAVSQGKDKIAWYLLSAVCWSGAGSECVYHRYMADPLPW